MVPNIMVVNNALPVKSVKEFIAYAKANPGKLNYGSPGKGSTAHLSMELFKTHDRHQHACTCRTRAAPACWPM